MKWGKNLGRLASMLRQMTISWFKISRNSTIILSLQHYSRLMHLRKYHALDSEEADEGFEQNPTISEEIIIQPTPHRGTFYSFNSIIPERSHKKTRYLSQEKPQFKLKALEESTRYLKRRNFNQDKPNLEGVEERSESSRLGVFGARKNKKLDNNRSVSNFQEALQAAIIKTKHSDIAENILHCSDPQQRQTSIKEAMLISPQAQLVYKEGVPDSTFTFFRHLNKNSCQPTFLSSKYNAALKAKMQRDRILKEETVTERPKKTDCIEFTGDFESGNLDYAIKVGEYQYNIFLRIDTNTRGHRSWFYFKVNNHYSESRTIQLNICNIKRKFKMIENGQKVHVQDQNKQNDWQPLASEIYIEPYGKKQFKISFELTLEPHQNLLVSLVPPYTYSRLLKDLQQCEGSPNFKTDILTHTITGLAIPLVTISKGAAKQRKNRSQGKFKKKLILISGRIHPSETCSSYIIMGLIRQLLSQQECYEEFLSNIVVKIIPMLNPDGVVFGNFRTNYLGDDLNRSFHRTDSTVYPEIIALKEIGKNYQNQFGDNFIGFLDMHGHSNQPNSFVYGPQHQQSSDAFVECRILPKIIDKMSKYFKYEMSEFRLQDYKFNTARGYFLKKLKVPSYTIQTSYALYRDKLTSDLRLMGIQEWAEYGRQLAASLVSYSKYLQIIKSNSTLLRKPRDNINSTGVIKKDKGTLTTMDFASLKKEIQKETATGSKNIIRNQEEQSDSDGESIGEDLSEKQKELVLKKVKQFKTASFLLPKVPKPSLALPAVIPSMLRLQNSDSTTSTMPRLANKFRQKKLVRPLNLSYEYTQYLLKNISDIGSLRPQVLQFNYSRKKGNETEIKKQTIVEL